MKKDVVLGGSVEGVVSYVSVVGRFNIDGVSVREVKIPLNFEIPQGAKPEIAIIDFTMMGRGDLKKWRTNIANFSLTKEFKPFRMWRDEDKWVAKFVYDVTAIFNLLLKEPVLRIHALPEGLIKVVQASLVVVFNDPELGRTEYQYLVSVEPTNAFSEKWDDEYEHMKAVLFSPVEVTTESTVRFGLCESKVLIPPESPTEVEIGCKARNLEINSKEPIIPLSVMITKETVKEARIEISEVKIEGDRLTIRVNNIGDSDADKVVIVIYDWGNVLERMILSKMAGGETYEATFDLSKLNVRKLEGINVRVIWSYKGVTRFTEKRVAVKKSVPG